MHRRSRIGRLFAALLIRGAEAPFILRDLEDSFNQDVARGLSPAEARRRDLENVLASAASVWADSLRSSAWRPAFVGVRACRPSLVDIRLGLRTIIRTPGLSFVAICALAIGIPIGLAPMHAVDALDRPLPGDPDGRIRTLCYWRDTSHEHATAGDYFHWQRSLRSFDSLAAYRPATVTLDMGGNGLSVDGIETTASTFGILRTPAMLGRVLHAEDEKLGAPGVVVVGHDLWRAQFGGDPNILGRSLSMGGVPFSIVGVMPAGFRFPTSHQLWMPLRLRDDGGGPRSGATLVVLGRLRDGVTPDSAKAELQALTTLLATADSSRQRSSGAKGDSPLFDRLRAAVLPAWHLTFDFPSPGGLRALPEFSLVQVLMLAPLFVACINVGLLVLAQTSTRGSEFAVRTALGASRGRILAQVFVEFMVLAVIAAGAGLLILDWFSARLLTALGITLPYWIDTGLNAATVLRGLMLAVGCAVIAGVAPAVRMTGRSIYSNIKRARVGRSGRRLGGWSGALIVIDVAVAVVAVGVAVGLWGKVQATKPHEAADGIRAAEVLSATLEVRSTERQHIARTQAALVERLREEPDVRAVTFATALPRMDHPVRRFDVDQDAGRDAAAGPPRASTAESSGPFKVRTTQVAIDFFDQLEQPLVAGRGFDSRDLGPEARTIIVNGTFAQRAFGSTDPIGRRVRQVTSAGAPDGPSFEIVGVVGHMGVHALTPSQDDGVYLPLAEGDVNSVRLAIWARGDPAVLAPRVHALARAVDPSAVIAMPVPLDQMFEGDWYFLRAFVLGAAILVGVLLSLAASALYAILSLVVSQRTREIGIRVALGADRWRIARDVATQAVLQIGAGVLLGLPFAGALCYEFLEVTGSDASVPGAVAMAFVLGVSVMLLVSIAACTVPTRRALRISPIDALRNEG